MTPPRTVEPSTSEASCSSSAGVQAEAPSSRKRPIPESADSSRPKKPLRIAPRKDIPADSSGSDESESLGSEDTSQPQSIISQERDPDVTV